MKQVKFKDNEDNIFGGILTDDGNIICGECGGLLEPEDFEIIEIYDFWVDLSDTIIGD